MTEEDHEFWRCNSCGYIFDPFANGDPDDCQCPECGSQDLGGVNDEE